MSIQRKNPISKAIRFALIGGAAVAAVSPVFAADEAQEEAQRIEVTGSKIKRTDIEGPSPVVVIDAEAINAQGFATVQDVLGSLTQNTGGQIDQGQTFGFTPGAAAVDLRGFGSGRTLVLLDGRRVPVYPVGLGGSSSFVDLSTIPAAAVERVEILTDGASAIYGSDAIAGVINVILRKDFDGVDVTMRYGNTEQGGYENGRVQFVAGNSSDKSSSTFVLEHYFNNELWARDRDYAGSDVANEFGAYSSYGSNLVGLLGTGPAFVRDPDCLDGQGVVVGTRCRFNRTEYRQLYPEIERTSAMYSFNYQMSDNVQFFTRFNYTSADVVNELEPVPYNNLTDESLIVEGDPRYPAAAVGTGEIYQYWRRLVEFGPRGSSVHNENSGILMGLEGTAFDAYDWEFGVSFNRLNVKDSSNDVIQSVMDRFVAEGLDLFDPIPQSVVDAASYRAQRNALSSNSLIDFNISGELFEMAGGAAQFAVAVDHLREWYQDLADPIAADFDLAGSGGVSGGGARKLTGFGLEVMLPVFEGFELNLAARYDSYDDESDVGSATSPRIAIAYRPIEDLLIRASYGKSFRAPDLFTLFNGQQVGFEDVLDVQTCEQLGFNVGDAGSPDDVCRTPVQSVEVQSAGSLTLEEEKGTNINFGVVWSITQDLSMSVDAYDIEVEDIVTSIDAQFIMNNWQEYGANIVRSGAQANGLRNGYIITGFDNLASQRIKGVDVSLDYKLNTGAGDFTTRFDVSYVDSIETQFTDESPVVENIGSSVLPEYRANMSLDWSMGDVGATVFIKWLDKIPGANFEVFDAAGEDAYIDSYTQINLQGRYDLPGVGGQLRLGVNNVADEEPPVDPTEFNWPWFRQEYHEPFGRAYYIEYNRSF